MLLSNFDAFSKSIAGAHEKTNAGAIVSVTAYIFMAVLFFSELRSFLQVEVVEQLTLDREGIQTLVDVNIDVEFLELGCEEVHVLYRGQHMDKTVVDVSASFRKTPTPRGGCRLQGSTAVPKVSGLIEVAPTDADKYNRGEQSVRMQDLRQFNASHVIAGVSFGKVFSGMSNPLNGFRGVRTDAMYQYQYQVKVVPTKVISLDNSVIRSNQYASTFYAKPSIDLNDPFAAFGLLQSFDEPGLFLRFEFSSILVEKRETKRSFIGFFTRMCGVVGGVFAVGELIDKVLHASILAKKVD